MFTLTIKENLSLSLYDSIKEFPAQLHLEAKLYSLQHSALATTEEDMNSQKQRLELLKQYDLQADYQIEAYNYQLSLRLLAMGYRPKELAWACHLQSVNDRPVTDYSEEGLIKQVEILKQQGLTDEHIDSSLFSIADQLEGETKRYYPRRVVQGRYNKLDRQIRYGLALADHLMLDTEESRGTLDKATLSVLTFQKPLDLRSDSSTLIQLEKAQFKLYTRLQESGCLEVNSLTVYQFYGWLEVLEERQEQQSSALVKVARK